MDFFFKYDSRPSPQFRAELNVLYTEYVFPARRRFGKTGNTTFDFDIIKAPLFSSKISEDSVVRQTISGRAEVSVRLPAGKIADEQWLTWVMSSGVLALVGPSCGFDDSFVDSIPRTEPDIFNWRVIGISA